LEIGRKKMFLNNSFGKNLDIVHRAMDVSMLRQQVIANNMANSDVPHFKRSNVNFESELKRVFDQNETVSTFQAKRTDERHYTFTETRDYRDVRPRTILDHTSTTKANGNNVDAEREVMLAVQNQLRYEAMVKYVSNQFSQMNIVLQ
jgi:flagellar basal-body rod protein FlgB